MESFKNRIDQAGEDMRCYYYSYSSQQQIIRNFSLMFFTFIFSSGLLSPSDSIFLVDFVSVCTLLVLPAGYGMLTSVKRFSCLPLSHLPSFWELRVRLLYTIKENVDREKHTAMWTDILNFTLEYYIQIQHSNVREQNKN